MAENTKKKNGKKRTFGKGMIGLVLFSILFLIVSGLFSYLSLIRHGSQLFAKHGDIQLPEFVGLPSAFVTGREEYAGFRFEVIEDYNSEVAPGIIFDQVPGPPKTVKDNARVTLYVSKGPRMVSVPDVIGMTYGEAMKAIQEAQLQVIRKTDTSGEKEQNTITAIDPEPGTVLEAGSSITIYVSSPVTSVTTKVPKIVDMDFSTAKATLAAYGLRIGSIEQVYDLTKAPGTVISQSVKPGATVANGTSIDVVITYGLEVFERTFRLELPYMDPTGKKVYKVEIFSEDGKEKLASFSDAGYRYLRFTRKGSVDEIVRIKIGKYWFRTIRLDYQNNTSVIVADFSSQNGFTLDPPSFPITLTCTEGGTVTGPDTAFQGEDITITIKAAPGYHIDQVLDNNFDVTASVKKGKYVIKNVQTFHEVHVFFEKDQVQPEPTPEPTPPGQGPRALGGWFFDPRFIPNRNLFS